MVDLSSYAKQILDDKDRPLFDDAVASAKVDALRAAYVMIWLSCAESLKRRFKEAQKRDSAASKIVREVDAKEKDHRSVDKYVLDKAKDYGFLSDSGHTVLMHIYEMRCLYGHPYEEAPSKEQLCHAAAVVVEYVLSQPVKLRHGFGEQLITSLLDDRPYLDDHDAAVSAFAKDIIPRIDEKIYQWFLDKYWSGLEAIATDSSMGVYFRRGIWFSRTMLLEVGAEVFSHEEWHDRVSRYPKLLMWVCGAEGVYSKIGERAQDALVGAILKEAGTRSGVLKNLERLHDAGALTDRQQERFKEHVADMSAKFLRSSGLKTTTCIDPIIEAIESHNFYIQNPAIDLVVSNGPEQAAKLSKDKQVELGRNILQAGEGTAGSANEFLDNLADDGASWPLDVLRGIALESFTNESNDIRFKDRHLGSVLTAMSHIKPDEQSAIIKEIAESVDAGSPKQWVDADDFEGVTKTLEPYAWAAPLVRSLESKTAGLSKD